ncbi:MAG: hypothetical protein JJE52_13980 [Acidimicrobiia bacterium]|nr:hypothetical protein [Acidimicrobiia bacterium]
MKVLDTRPSDDDELADPAEVHQRLAATLDEALDAIGDIQTSARAGQRR